MNIELQVPSSNPAAHVTLDLRVRYIAVKHPFVDPAAPAQETLAQLKPKVLAFFKLTEGPVPGGRTKVYEFAHDGHVLIDLNETLASVARGHHELHLDLLERFEQG